MWGQLRISDKTLLWRVSDFLHLYDEETIERIKRAAERRYGDPWDMSLGQFFACFNGDFSHIGMTDDYLKTTLYQYMWADGVFKDMLKQFIETLETLVPPQTPESRKASAGCKPIGFEESTNIFCRDYFGLHSFAEVDRLKVGEFLLAKKDAYNKAIFEKGMAEIQKQKMNNHEYH